MNIQFDIIAFGFIILTFFYYGWLLMLVYHALRDAVRDKRSANRQFMMLCGGVIFWMAATAWMAFSGFLSDFSGTPPRFVIIVAVPLLSVFYLSTRAVTNQVLERIPPRKLLYLQSFRIFVELFLWLLFMRNLLPVQMTFEGRNWDILVGLSGPLVAILLSRQKISMRVVRIWNLLGLLLLLNIVVIAILSTPAPFRVFMNEPANTIVMTFPFVWLPALLVPLAYLLHILSFKQMSLLDKGSLPGRS